MKNDFAEFQRKQMQIELQREEEEMERSGFEDFVCFAAKVVMVLLGVSCLIFLADWLMAFGR